MEASVLGGAIRRILVRVAATPWLAGVTVAPATSIVLALAAAVAGTTGVVVALAVLAVISLGGVVVAVPVLVRLLLRRLGAGGVGGSAAGTRLDVLHDEHRQLSGRLAEVERQLGVLREHRMTALVDAAQQASSAGQVETAIGHFEDALVLSPADADLRSAHADLVDQLEAGQKGTSRVARAVDRQLAVGHHGQARELVRRGLERVPHSLRLRDREVALLAHEGDHARALAVAGETAELRCEQWEARRPRHRTPRQLEVHERIAISGFFYSGSGAAKDHLRGYREVVPWPPVGELRIVKFPGGFADLGRRLSTAGELTAADLVDHYLHLVGRRITGAAEGVYDKWEVVNANSRRLLRDADRSAGYLAACMDGFLQLVERSEAGPLSPEEFTAHARGTLQHALDAAATDTGAGWLLIDQVVTGWHLDQAAYLPPVSFVLVHRDPRDRFAEVREVLAQPGRRAANRDPATFARTARRHLAEAEQRVAWLEGLGHRVLRVAFEDLVLEPERTIAAIDEHLGLTAAEQAERRFHPERSRRNVGKHVALVPPEELAIIEREAADLLDPRAVPAPDAG
jgi:hypothetical protein